MKGILIANDAIWQKYKEQLLPLMEDYNKRAKKHCVFNDYKDWDMVEWIDNFINYPQIMMCAIWDEEKDKFIGFVVFEIVNFVDMIILFWRQTYVIPEINFSKIIGNIIEIITPISLFLGINLWITLSLSDSINKVLKKYDVTHSGYFWKIKI
ncbi:MAG: hypothetical protein ACTSSF_00490 [Candidatus Heimdallarchaeaceae archaeon]